MMEIIQENKLRRQRYELRSQEVKITEDLIKDQHYKDKNKEVADRFERVKKIRERDLERLKAAKQKRNESHQQNQVIDFLKEEPLFQKMARIDIIAKSQEAERFQLAINKNKASKPYIDFKELRAQAASHQRERVERLQPQIEKSSWRPPPASKFQRETWLREQQEREQHNAKKELKQLLLEKKHKFSDFISKYLKPKQSKNPSPLFKKLEPRRTIKFSPSEPLLNVHRTPAIKKVLEPLNQKPTKVRNSLQTPKTVVKKETKVSNTLNESKQLGREVTPGDWNASLHSSSVPFEKKVEIVQHAAKNMEQRALRTEAKLSSRAQRSNRSQTSFTRSPRLFQTTSVKILPLPHPSSYYENLTAQVNEIEMTDTLLVDAIKAKMALLVLELSN